MDKAQEFIKEIFEKADIAIDGDRPWDVRVHNPRLYRRVVGGGTLAFGESYMDGWWDSAALDETVSRLVGLGIDRYIRLTPAKIALIIGASLGNLGSKAKAFEVGERHYNIGNDLFGRMLDKRMAYTCGYWKDARNLDEAQEAKLDLVCRKLNLQKGQKILDIGCGWGSFAKFAAEKYGVSVVGVTVSAEQVSLGKELCKGLPIEFRLQDYRDVKGDFDHIVSLGMFEHVGYKNYREYMKVAHDHLKDGGLFLLHTIGGNFSTRHTDPWIDKYIFPNGMIPSIVQIGKAIEKKFVMEDWHNFGADYDRTLMAWFANFDRHWSEIKDRYDERFYRMWKFYLLACAGNFRARGIHLWQIVLSKKGVPGGYKNVR
jgi:cyclopropane-fatty-acyl-phospholipid synthase